MSKYEKLLDCNRELEELSEIISAGVQIGRFWALVGFVCTCVPSRCDSTRHIASCIPEGADY